VGPKRRTTNQCAGGRNETRSRNAITTWEELISLPAIAATVGRSLVVVTTHDYPSGLHAERAGVDAALVGDALGMVALGHNITQPVTLDAMVHHCAAARRDVATGLLVADLPLARTRQAPLRSCARRTGSLRRTARTPLRSRVEAASCTAVSAIVERGIAAMGHVGLTPQAVSVIGGFHSVGRDARTASKVLDEAQVPQEARAFAVVLECVPGPVAQMVTDVLDIPTIGIGSGTGCRGQALVYHDLLGMTSRPDYRDTIPRFTKQYAHLGNSIDDAIQNFAD
jgi:3-methyl-2-oxobutanoate hydroxymethyltransferase